MDVRFRVYRRSLEGNLTHDQCQEIKGGQSVQIDGMTYKLVFDDDYVNDDQVEVDIFGSYSQVPEWLVLLNPPVWITIRNDYLNYDQPGKTTVRISADQIEVESESIMTFLRSASIMVGEAGEFADEVSEKIGIEVIKMP